MFLMVVNRNFFYESFVKPLFFQFSPETAHELAVSLLETSKHIPGFFPILQKMTTYSSKRLETNVCGIPFANPIGMAAGFDKTGKLYPLFSKMGFGYIEIGTITGLEQPGNPKPRLFRFPDEEAILNRMGFNNDGSEKTFETLSNQTKTIPRGINLGKSKLVENEKAVGDYLKSFDRLHQFADYIVINISSPNTPGLRDLQNTKTFETLVKSLLAHYKNQFPKPVFVKFAPDLAEEELFSNLEICISSKISGVILTNTTIDKSVLNHKTQEAGGISGKPLREKSLSMIRKAYSVLKGKIPIIGVGGIDSPEAALQFILAGANLLQIYTSYVYKGPLLPFSINEGIDQFLKKHSIANIDSIVGKEKDFS